MAVKTRNELETAAAVIRDETSEGGNTPARVGGCLRDLVDSMPLATEVPAAAAPSRVLYVDSSSAVTPADGSSRAPFTTVQAAHNAATAGTTIRIIRYTAAGGLAITKEIVIAADRVFTRKPRGYARAGENISIGAVTVTGSPTVTLSGVSVSTIATAGTLNINSACDVSGAITGEPEIRASDSDFGANITAGFGVFMSNCRLQGGLQINVSGEQVEMYGCEFDSSTTIEFTDDPGILTLDTLAYGSWTQFSGTLTNGDIEVKGGLPVLVDTYTSGSPTWTKDPLATKIGIRLKGSGAGGAAVSGGVGGGGGSAGEDVYQEFPASLVPATLSVSIGLAGAAGSDGASVSVTGNAGAFVISANGGLTGVDGGAGGVSYDPNGLGNGGGGGSTSGTGGVRGRGAGAGGTGGTNAPGGGGKGYGAGGGGGAGASDGGGGGGGGYGDGVTGGTIAASNGTSTVGGAGALGVCIITTWRG
jgi:hypothetical protein